MGSNNYKPWKNYKGGKINVSPNNPKGIYDEKNGKYYEPTMRDTMKSHGFTDKQSDQMEDQITKQLAELRTGRKDMTDDMIVTTDKDGIRTYNDPDVYHGRGEVVKGSVRYG